MSTPSDDLSQLHLDRQQQLTDDSANAWAQERLAAIRGMQPQAVAPTGPPGPADAQQPDFQKYGVVDPATVSGGTVHPIAGRIAGDISHGAPAIPREALGGAIDAVHQEAKTTKDVADWLSGHLPEALRGGLAYDSTQGLHFASGDEIQQTPGFLESIANLVPSTSSSGTVTGGIARSIAQFITGQAILGPALGKLGEAGMAGRVAEGAAVGATAFDPEQHLSNLIQQVPELQNPVTEWLSAKPEDSAALGRLKNSIEALGIGTASEGLVKGLQAAKAKIFAHYAETAAGDTQGAARALVAQTEAQKGELAKIIGDPNQPAVQIQPKAAEQIPPADLGMPSRQAAQAIAESHATGPGEVKLNWAAMTDEQDVNAALQTLADAYQGEIANARGGVKTFAATRASAAELDAWNIARDTVPRGALDQDQMLALKEFYLQSGRETYRLAQMVNSGVGGDFSRVAFDRQMAIHELIQNRFSGAKATAGRTLNILKTTTGAGPAQFADQFAQLRSLVGTDKGLDEMAKGVVQLGDAGMAREMNAFVQSARQATNPDRIRQLWYSGLLSNPLTYARNLVGNTSNLLIDIPETAFAEGPQIAKEKLFGLIQGSRDAWTLMKRGQDVLESEVAPGLKDMLSASKLDPMRTGAWNPEAMGVPPSSPLGRFYSFVDTATTFQGRWLDQADRAYKALAYNMEMRAGAYRQASEELAKGTLERPDFADRLAQLVTDPSETAKLEARTFSEVKTFQNQPLATPLWKAVKDYHQIPLLGDVTLPFAKTPYNIATQVMQRTPIAPFMKSWAQDMAAGGSKAELAWTRFAMGSTVMLTAADLTLSGHLTGQGPADPAMRATLAREGWKPWSVKIGDRYFDYRVFDPIGPAIGLAAYTAETLAGRDFGDASGFERTQQAATSAALGISAQMLNQTFMQGMAGMINAISDPQRAGDPWIQRMVTSAIVPRGVAQLERILDPTQRAAYDIVSSVRSQMPIFSVALPAQRDLWGRVRTISSGIGWIYDLLSPVSSSKENAQPIDQEIMRLQAHIAMPDKKVGFQVMTPKGMRTGTVDLWNHPEMFQRYLELSGQIVPERLSGKPLLEALNDLATGKHPISPLYQVLSDGPDGGKANQIQEMIRHTRDDAKRRLLDEFPALEAEAARKAEENPGRFNLQ